jgi:outer membrane protein
MKKFTVGSVLSIAIALQIVTSASTQQAHADDAQKIGLIDMQKAIQNSEEGKKAKSELETAFNKKKKELQGEESNLKKLQEDFQKQQAALSETAKKKKQDDLQAKFMKYQELLQKSQTEIQKKEQEMSEPIIKKIRVAVGDVAKKRNYSMVLEKNENVVIYSSDKDDVTDDVIAQINKK